MTDHLCGACPLAEQLHELSVKLIDLSQFFQRHSILVLRPQLKDSYEVAALAGMPGARVGFDRAAFGERAACGSVYRASAAWGSCRPFINRATATGAVSGRGAFNQLHNGAADNRGIGELRHLGDVFAVGDAETHGYRQRAPSANAGNQRLRRWPGSAAVR